MCMCVHAFLLLTQESKLLGKLEFSSRQSKEKMAEKVSEKVVLSQNFKYHTHIKPYLIMGQLYYKQ